MVAPRRGSHHGGMKIPDDRAGATLAELVLSLSILAWAAGLALPRLAGARDEYAVRAARAPYAARVK